MWTWLAGLPIYWQIIFPSAALLIIIFMVLFGKIAIEKGRFGLWRINFSRRKKRSCGDCVLLIMGKREIYMTRRRYLEDSILKDQMNFVEQKMIEMQTKLTSSYRDDITSSRNSDSNPTNENKEYILYREALKNAFLITKDEIRRSFKENGFYDISGTEYTQYIKGKTQTLISMIKDYLINHYPFEGMIVCLYDRFSKLDESWIEDQVFDIFGYAKEVKKITDEMINKAELEFVDDINNFIGESIYESPATKS